MLRVDAHHHLWEYTAAEYDWLDDDLAMLRRNFMPADLVPEMQLAGVTGTVAVQARQTVEETDWLLEPAVHSPLILGVVDWLPLRDPYFPSFNDGIDALRCADLVYDILIFERQLEEAICFIDRDPHQAFVLDHIAKPLIAAGGLKPWAHRVRELARRPNIVCKVSGMVTETDPKYWSADQLKPYFDTVLECFTPARLMAGSDWPVLCAGCTYPHWWKVLSDRVIVVSAEEQAEILGRTAAKTYGLIPLPKSQPQDLESHP
jgi:L-fuconolactonase